MEVKRPIRVVVAGKMPPPYGGQNLNIQRLVHLLSGIEGIQVLYWELAFSKQINQFRKQSIGKLVELARVMSRLVRLYFHGGRFDYILFPTGGPHLAPILRDLILLPYCRLFCPRIIVHFRAAGIGRKMKQLPFWQGWMLRAVHRLCWGAVTLSEYGRTDPEALKIPRVFVIPNAIEDHNPEGKISGFPEDRITLLNVGHLCSDKGTPALLEAFAKVSRTYPRVTLRLVGECLAPYSTEQLQADIRRLQLDDSVELAGLKTGDALFDEYRRASLFVFPSMAPYESFGMVLIEAMMFGLPLVVSDWRANAEVARGMDCGGIIYQPSENHAQALAAALRQALEQMTEWNEWGRRNRKHYETYYRINRLRENFGSLLVDSR